MVACEWPAQSVGREATRTALVLVLAELHTCRVAAGLVCHARVVSQQQAFQRGTLFWPTENKNDTRSRLAGALVHGACVGAVMAPAQAAPPAGDEAPDSPEAPPRVSHPGTAHGGSRGDGSHLAFMLAHDRGAAKTEVTVALLEAALAASTSEKELVLTLQRCCLAGAWCKPRGRLPHTHSGCLGTHAV